MDKFCQVVFKIAEISNSAEKDVIQQHITDFTSNFHTPNHPPYAAMIEKAITELNEKTGLSEELISNYIKLEYKDLPWAHSTILKHHLSKLCDFGEISMTCKGRYIIGVPKPKRENINRKLKSKSMRGRSRRRKEINIDETLQEERIVMRENKNKEKYTLEIPNVAIGEDNEVTLNIPEQDAVVDLISLPVTSGKLEQVKTENLQEYDTIFTPIRKVNLDLHEKEEVENHPSSEVKLNLTPVDGKKLEIEGERTDLEKVGLTEELNLALEHLNAATEKENEDAEYEPVNRLNHNFLQSESRLTKAPPLCLNLDLHEKEEDEKHLDLEAESNPKPEYGNKLEIDSEITDLVKVGLAEEHNLAPAFSIVEMAKENVDAEAEVDIEPENNLNHNIQQSESSLKTDHTFCVSLESHEKEDNNCPNLEELNPKLVGKELENDGKDTEGQELEKDGEKPDNFSAKPEKNVKKPESDGEKPDLTLNSEHINEEDESKSEKDDLKAKKDDEKTNLTLSSDHVDEEDGRTTSINDGGKPEEHGKTPEKHGVTIDLTPNPDDMNEEEENNISENKTDEQQRQLKRCRQRQVKVKPEQIPMTNKDILDEENCQPQKQESGIRQQPKRLLRSQTQSQTSETLVNREQFSTPENSTVLKRAKISTECQTRRLTRSSAAKSAEENKISQQTSLQRMKLRSWRK